MVGLILASKNNENSIFFPAAGYIIQDGSGGQGEGFYAWTSLWYSESPEAAILMGASGSGGCGLQPILRYFGFPTRGVLGELNDYNPGGGAGPN